MIEQKRLTLRDIARLAQVSTGTVSMVLNNNPLVAAKTREHVRQIIDQFGYVYNRSGAQLRKKKTGVIGVSICNLANPYFAEITVGLEESLSELGLALILGNSADSIKQQNKFLNTAREHNVDALLLMPAVGTTRAMVESMLGWGIPIIMVSRYVPGVNVDYAGSDNLKGLAQATQHLLDLGHQRIAFVGGGIRTTSGRDRLNGYKTALRETGRGISDELIIKCSDTRSNGFMAVQELYKLDSPPTAIVCFNDILAFGVMLGLRSMGLEPGKDCSVIGNDDVAEAVLWRPGLTTVAAHSREIGLNAGQLLRKRLETRDRPPERIILKPEVIIRDSTSPYRP